MKRFFLIALAAVIYFPAFARSDTNHFGAGGIKNSKQQRSGRVM
tara:strand:- start:30 stop:161 length:132 start_codon:yes stop_codon:yes gene_type:complete